MISILLLPCLFAFSLAISDEFDDDIGPGEMLRGWHLPIEEHFVATMEHPCDNLEVDAYQETKFSWPPQPQAPIAGKINRIKCTNRTPQLVKIVIHIIDGGINEDYFEISIAYSQASTTETMGIMKVVCHVHTYILTTTTERTTEPTSSSTPSSSPSSVTFSSYSEMTSDMESNGTTTQTFNKTSSSPSLRSCGCPWVFCDTCTTSSKVVTKVPLTT